jgi:hypothetical protein
MMLCRWLLAALLCLAVAPASALLLTRASGGGSTYHAATIHNYVSSLTSTQIHQFDINGNSIDVSDARILQVGTTAYLYGDANGCGQSIQNNGVYCGVNIYQVWADANGNPQFQFLGQPFDPTGSPVAANCSPTATSPIVFPGCYNTVILFNAANNNYVIWINGAQGTNQSYMVWTCASVAQMTSNGCAAATAPAHLGHGGSANANGDYSLAIDGSGNAWIAYSNNNSGRHIFAQELNSSFTDATGSDFDTGVTGEGVGLFVVGSTYYITYGPLAEYFIAATDYISSTSPLSAWSGITALNSNSCSGQNGGGTPTAIPGTQVLYLPDRWAQALSGTTPGLGNQALNNIYWAVFAFTGSALNAITCAPSNSITLPAGPVPTPYWAGAQTGSEGLSGVAYWEQGSTQSADLGEGDLSPPYQRAQSFTAPTNLSSINFVLTTGQANRLCKVNTGCTGPTAGLTATLFAVDGSHHPTGSALATQTLASAAFSWAPQRVTFTFSSLSLIAGTEYAVAFSSPTNTAGGYTFAYNDTGAYSGGVESFSSNGGSTWTTEAGRVMKFSVQ